MLKNLIQRHTVYRSLVRQQTAAAPFMMMSNQQRLFGAFVNHRDTADNLEESPFEFTQENYIEVNKHIAKFPDNYKHSAVIPVLFIA